jgi:RecB family exonuclease
VRSTTWRKALRELSRHLSERLQRFECTPAAALAQLLHSGEKAVEASFGEASVVVSGRLDALYADARGGLDVVEYKLTDEANDELDRAQVALYRLLLRVAHGVDARPVVLRFSPTLREMAMTEQASGQLSRAARAARRAADGRLGQRRRAGPRHAAPGPVRGLPGGPRMQADLSRACLRPR